MTSGDWWDSVDWWTDPRLSFARGLDEAAGQYDLGWLAASEAYGEAVQNALTRPGGHGGPDLDARTESTIAKVFERYAGVPLAHALAPRVLRCGCKTSDVLNDHGRLHGALILDAGNRS
jgi:hypothetical protein